MKALVLAAGILAVSVVPVAGALAAPPQAAAAPTVQDVMISGFAFMPATVTIASGTTVRWTNHDTAPHDVTVTNGPVAVHSPTLKTGQSWDYSFTTSGTYSYICSIHPDMHAAVTVRQATPAATRSSDKPAAPPLVSRTSSIVPAQPVPLVISSSAQPADAPAAPRTQSPTATQTFAKPAAQALAAGPSTTRELKPLLVVAGVVAAVATFCLLLLASSPNESTGQRPNGSAPSG